MNKDIRPDKTSPAYLKNKNSGGLFKGFLYVLLFMSILSLAIWQNYSSSSTSSKIQSTEARLAIIEEQMNIADEVNNDSLTDISSSIQFLDKEIRKLWDLSNKRNKVNIANLDNEVKKHSNALKEIALIQTNDQKNINAIKEQSQKLKILLNKLNESNQENASMIDKISELSNSILLMEETIQAFDVYRRQNNELLQEMQLQISSIESL